MVGRYDFYLDGISQNEGVPKGEDASVLRSVQQIGLVWCSFKPLGNGVTKGFNCTTISRVVLGASHLYQKILYIKWWNGTLKCCEGGKSQQFQQGFVNFPNKKILFKQLFKTNQR